MQRDLEVKVISAKEVILKAELHEVYNNFGGFACTADLWTDQFRQKCYLSITAHLCTVSSTGFQYNRYVISLREIDEMTKTKEVVENHILAIFSSYGFSQADVKSSIYFVTDRGSHFKTTDKYDRANCWAHLLNNIVEDMCKLSEVKEIISNAAALVRYMKKAGLHYRLNFSLKSFVDTRWSTVYNMLHSIIPHYETIYRLLEEREKDRNYRGCLKYIECLKKSTLDKIAALLKPFKEWTDIIEADKSITIHKVWPVYRKMMDYLRVSTDDDVWSDTNSKMIEDMKSRGRDYIRQRRDDFEPTLEQKMAVALHPKFKKLSKVDDSSRKSTLNLINTLIAQGEPLPPSAQKEKRKSQNLFDDFVDSDDDEPAELQQSQYCKELNDYLRMSSSGDEFYNEDDTVALSKWWFKCQSIFPNMFKLFVKYSMIPASSAPSERCFSVTGQIISSRRSCLLPKNVSNIMACRNLYRN